MVRPRSLERFQRFRARSLSRRSDQSPIRIPFVQCHCCLDLSKMCLDATKLDGASRIVRVAKSSRKCSFESRRERSLESSQKSS